MRSGTERPIGKKKIKEKSNNGTGNGLGCRRSTDGASRRRSISVCDSTNKEADRPDDNEIIEAARKGTAAAAAAAAEVSLAQRDARCDVEIRTNENATRGRSRGTEACGWTAAELASSPVPASHWAPAIDQKKMRPNPHHTPFRFRDGSFQAPTRHSFHTQQTRFINTRPIRCPAAAAADSVHNVQSTGFH